MAKDERYNGWTNYETWRVNLEFFDGMSVEDITGGNDVIDAYDLAEMMKEMVLDNVDQSVQDYILQGWLDAFISEVNFTEIARRKIEDYS